LNSFPGLGVKLFSHSDIKWLAVRLRVAGPNLLSAGQGIGSFFSIVRFGLAASETVDASVVASDVALEERESFGLSSQVSHVSVVDVTDPATDDGDFM